MGGGLPVAFSAKIAPTIKYDNIVSLANLLAAWQEFVRGKRNRKDVQEFERNLMANIISLHEDLVAKTYHHSAYKVFIINDPKRRVIHKASVRDRVLHRAVYRRLYWFFHPRFISDSYSCRNGKGTHKAIKKFALITAKLSRNNTKMVWVLKCDIRKFFASIDRAILIDLLRKKIPDQGIIWLIEKIIYSFNSGVPGQGLPLGNLTSQLFANVYLNELDQFMKHSLKARHYLRYADDFVIVGRDKDRLVKLAPEIAEFLKEKLKLEFHPNKILLERVSSGVDFLGWVQFSKHRVLRTMTRRRMFKRINKAGVKSETVQSYLGLLDHGNGWKLRRKIESL